MGTLKYAILGLLNRNEMTGYELSKEFETTLFEFWNAKHSQIYPELKSLNAEGLIQYRVEITGNVLEMKDGAIFRNGRKRSARSRRHLRMNPVCGSSSSTAPHRISSSDFLPTSFPSIRSIWNICWKTRKNLMKSRLRMTARFRIISSCAARCTGKKLRCSGFRNASSSAGSGLRNQKNN